jgi:hypothetical protein
VGFVEDKVSSGRNIGLDLVVVVLGVLLVYFLVTTMGVRSEKQAVVDECQDRLLALSQAQQSYLVKYGEFARELAELRPFLDVDHEGMPFTCPITGFEFAVAVQGNKYVILAPGTGSALAREDGDFTVTTGDPNW